MFRFVTKKELWTIEDSGIEAHLYPGGPPDFSLKAIQDKLAYKYLRHFKGKIIAEAGGGNSRLLPTLARQNSCYNIDPFEGAGQGPKVNSLPPEIVSVKSYLGRTDAIINDGAFDVLFSISVVEHVPDDELESFFADSRRILKADHGFALHMIDISTAEEPLPGFVKRYQLIKDEFFQHFLPLPGEIMGRDGDWAKALRFRPHYASNPDNVMRTWSMLVPESKEVYETHQCCTLILAGWAKCRIAC